MHTIAECGILRVVETVKDTMMQYPFDVYVLVETCDSEQPIITLYQNLRDAQEALLARVVVVLEDLGKMEEATYLRTLWKNSVTAEDCAIVTDVLIDVWDEYDSTNWLFIEGLRA